VLLSVGVAMVLSGAVRLALLPLLG